MAPYKSSGPAFGVGCAKAATHALAAIGGVRAAHEPDAEAMLRLTLAHATGQLHPDSYAELTGKLIEKRKLALDVSQINGFMIETLYRLYPDARYILTIREARGWLRSFVNHQLTIPNAPGSAWQAFRDLRFANAPTADGAGDTSMGIRGLYPVDAYLGYWVSHNAKVLATVPIRQLLVVPTAALDASLPKLATFLDWPALRRQSSVPRAFEGRYIPSPLDALDQDWLDERIAWHVAALIAAAGNRFDAEVKAALTTPR